MNITAVRGNDPLVTSLFVATVIHVIVILGVSFVTPPEPDVNRDYPTLDITVVPRHRSDAPPDNPDFLAAVNRDGTGNRAEPVAVQEASTASRKRQPDPARKTPAQLTRKKSDTRAPSAARLIERSMEMLALNEQINRSREAYSKRPRQTFIDARTREHKYASYLAAWVAKVERVGNLNYPDEARRRQLSGTLLLQVALKPDGSIHDISLLRSSGYQALDDAAMRIVKMSAPFAPFPTELWKDTDILVITRTWEFLSSNRLYSR